MCKYCEPINKQSNWCKSIADTGFENVAIVYGRDAGIYWNIWSRICNI